MLHNHLDMFKKRENIVEIEEGKFLSPKFDNDGLIPVITMCSKTKDIFGVSTTRTVNTSLTRN